MGSKESSRKILIIDDDSDCRKLLLNWLASQFLGVEAVEYDPLTQGVPDKDFDWSAFDVLLLDYDLRLGDVTGLDILQTNHDNLLFPTTIMLTGAGNEEVAVRAIRSGVSDYLRKDQLKKEKLKAAIDDAFAQQSSKRQRLYTLNDAMQVAKAESKKIINAYKAQYEKEHEQEMARLQAEVQKIQQELEKSQSLLASLEEDQKDAEVEKCKLLIEMQELSNKEPTLAEEANIQQSLDSTREELLRANTSIKNVQQDIKKAKESMEKARWKQEQGNAEQEEVEYDLTLVLEDMQQTSDAKAEMQERLDMFFNRDMKKINTEEENQKLFEEITTQLDTKDE